MTLDERVSRYIAKCPPAISGSDGHGVTFRVACALVHGFALDAADALRHLTIYNAGCCPPWKPRELRHKIEQAGKVAHEKPRGHLLGKDEGRRPGNADRAPKPVPVRSKGEKAIYGRFGRSQDCLAPNARAHTHIMQLSGVCSVRSVRDERRAQIVAPTGPQPSEPSEILEGLISVPGCQTGRPEEIDMADEDWRKLDASGFASEPLVQMAAWMFGPCSVIEIGRAAA